MIYGMVQLIPLPLLHLLLCSRMGLCLNQFVATEHTGAHNKRWKEYYYYYYYYNNYFMAPWVLSGTTQVSQYQKGKTREEKPIWIYWSKREWVAVASAGPYANLHLTQTDNHTSIPPLSFYRLDALLPPNEQLIKVLLVPVFGYFVCRMYSFMLHLCHICHLGDLYVIGQEMWILPKIYWAV